MFRNYLITFWRNIIKNGVFSVINIFGLAIGFSIFVVENPSQETQHTVIAPIVIVKTKNFEILVTAKGGSLYKSLCFWSTCIDCK